MAKKTSTLSRLVVIGITLIILLVPFGVYFSLYVSSQGAFFTRRSHRLLARIGSQVVSRVDGLQKVVRYGASRRCNEEFIIDAAKLPSYFKAITPFGIELEFHDETAQSQVDRVQRKSGAPPPVSLEFKPIGPANQITFHYRYEVDEEAEANTCEDIDLKKELLKLGRFLVSSDTGELLRPVVERFVRHERRDAGEDLFDKVLVADADTGAVIFQYGMDEVTIANLDELLGKGASGAPNHKNLEGQTAEEGSDPRQGVSALSEAEVASGDYKLFVQPIQLTVAKSGSESGQGFKLTVCGLVRSSSFRDKTLSFSFAPFILVIVLVLLTTLSGPVIKLKLLGPKDALRKADVVLTTCSIFFGSALLVLTLLAGHTYITLENQLDDQLELLADDIDRNLRNELASIVDQLDALNKRVSDDLSKLSEDSQQHLERILSVKGWLDPTQSAYPYFNTATWVQSAGNRSGEQKVKYTTRTQPPTFVNVTGRRYFDDAKANKLWCVTAGQDRSLSLCLEPVNSRTSGENVAVVSKPTAGGAFVSAVDSRLMSLYGPVLPAGYGFCVIESSGPDAGRVLFHSDDIKNLEENFFEECNNDRQLRAAVHARSREKMGTPYLGRDHAMIVTPIQDLPWTLVVFRDERILRTVNVEIITLTVIAFLVYIVLTAVVLALILLFKSLFKPLFRSKHRSTGLWPDPDKLESYQRVAAVNCPLFMVFLLAVTMSGRGALMIWALLFPALGFWQLRRMLGPTANQEQTTPTVETASSEQTTPRRWLAAFRELSADFRRGYSLALVSVLALTSVAPTMAFFKLVRDAQVGIFLRMGQVSLARGLEKREDQVRNHYSSLLGLTRAESEANQAEAEAAKKLDKADAAKLTSALETSKLSEEAEAEAQPAAAQDDKQAAATRTKQFIRKRLRLRWDVYESFFFRTEWIDRAGTRAPSGQKRLWPDRGPLAWFLTTFSPLYNETSVESVLLPRGKSYDNHWESPENENNVTLIFQPTKSTTTGEDMNKNEAHAWTLSSVIPAFTGVARPLWWLLLFLMAVLLVLCYFAIGFAARRIFLLDLETPRSKDSRPENGNHLVLSPLVSNLGDRFPPDSYLHVDARSICRRRCWKKKDDFENPEKLTVLLHHFEFNRDDPSCNEQKLRVVEKLLNRGERVIVLSSVDPMSFPLTSSKKSNETTANEINTNAAESSRKGVDDGRGRATVASDVERWAAVFHSFVRVIGLVPRDARTDPKTSKALSEAVSPVDSLSPAADSKAQNHYAAEESVAEAGDQANAYYLAVWSTCTPGEKVTLCQVAQHGLVSRLDPDIRGLMQKGLIERDPSLRMNESFRRFVIRSSAEEGVLAYRAEVESSWEKWKVPLLITLLIVIAFLFATQRDRFNQTLTLVSAVTGGIVAFLRLAGVFSRDKAGGTPA